ncbi:MAG: metallophosphoesterase [Bacteroidales bacterium]
MPVLIILLTLEILTYLVLREHYQNSSRPKFYISLTFNFILSTILWYFFIRSRTFKGFYDNPENISLHMNLAGMICAVAFPRFLLSLFHFTGRLLRIRRGTYMKGVTVAGLLLSTLIFLVVTDGVFIGRFNFRTEKITLKIKNLKLGLNGLRIVQISDLHLPGFYNHYDKLQKAIEIVNDLKPDLIFNTGDFISYGWREFDSCDTILAREKSRYGNFAIIGNHDVGTYFPRASLPDKADILMKVSEKIRASGYIILNESNIIREIGGAKVAFIGVITGGRHSRMIHGDLRRAMEGTDSADFKIFLCHDPNQWKTDVAGKTDINLTLSGHTHGMQIGVITKWFRWSPAKYYYPHWNGLYSEGNQYHYVNRGLGTMAVPFRIWMPPEITLITLAAE